jgi:hypothetical protein
MPTLPTQVAATLLAVATRDAPQWSHPTLTGLALAGPRAYSADRMDAAMLGAAGPQATRDDTARSPSVGDRRSRSSSCSRLLAPRARRGAALGGDRTCDAGRARCRQARIGGTLAHPDVGDLLLGDRRRRDGPAGRRD